ncbi:MAG: phosphoribosylanthranilate isomerase [Bacillota bacterium]|nr:phosphoribosylanthranilate isomerase [Bacillota bacterium]
MKVKICGILDVTTAKTAVEYGSDAIGFVFADSKRKIDPKTARAIVRELPKNILKIGVFVNETKEVMEKVASYVGLTHLQLHGRETPDFCQTLSLPVIKAISVSSKEDIGFSRQFSCEYILLDGPKGRYQGGNGETFDWTHIKQETLSKRKWILAGGLTNENVRIAIQETHPYMVDVSSGVETNGVKDLRKIKSFIEKAKGARTGGEIG